ncbi:MAG: ribosome-binding factor A [Christensenellales bacterium]
MYGNKDKIDATFDGIVRAGGYIRKELSLAFRDIRQVPELRFIKDDSLDYSAKIESVMRRSKE